MTDGSRGSVLVACTIGSVVLDTGPVTEGLGAAAGFVVGGATGEGGVVAAGFTSGEGEASAAGEAAAAGDGDGEATAAGDAAGEAATGAGAVVEAGAVVGAVVVDGAHETTRSATAANRPVADFMQINDTENLDR
jgi:hypothetical protein